MAAAVVVVEAAVAANPLAMLPQPPLQAVPPSAPLLQVQTLVAPAPAEPPVPPEPPRQEWGELVWLRCPLARPLDGSARRLFDKEVEQNG